GNSNSNKPSANSRSNNSASSSLCNSNSSNSASRCSKTASNAVSKTDTPASRQDDPEHGLMRAQSAPACEVPAAHSLSRTRLRSRRREQVESKTHPPIITPVASPCLLFDGRTPADG